LDGGDSDDDDRPANVVQLAEAGSWTRGETRTEVRLPSTIDCAKMNVHSPNSITKLTTKLQLNYESMSLWDLKAILIICQIYASNL
jgi:hypothetical protein